MQNSVKSGEIYWAKDVPTVNRYGEICHKNRPVIVVTNNKGLQNSGICTVLPLSSKIEKAEKTHCNVIVGCLLPKPSVTMSEQLVTISQSNLLGKKIESLDSVQFELVKDAIIRQLGLR